MANLWSTYKPPQNELELNSVIAAWMPFFGTVPERQVTQAIMEIAAEGGDFAPQIGQIYKRVKDNKQLRLAAGKKDMGYYYHLCCMFADVSGIDPPNPSMDYKELRAWFEEAKKTPPK